MGKARPALVSKIGNASIGRPSRRRSHDDGLVTVAIRRYSADEPRDGATLMRAERSAPAGLGVMVCHPAGQTHADQVRPEWWPVPRALALDGDFVCLACDLGDGRRQTGVTSGPHSWGNDYSLHRMDDAVAFIRGPDGPARDGPLLIAGTSMGALIALNWARLHRSEVAAVVLACPVLDLERTYRDDRGGLGASIAAAYGVRSPAPLPDLVAHSPVRYAADLAGLPVRLYATADDPIASDVSHCREWARTVGDSVGVVDLGAGGHSPAATPVGDALAFASRFL